MLHRKIELLCITCPRTDISYDEQVKLACEGGADMIQFRDKVMCDKELFETAEKLSEICKKYNVYFTVNNRIDVADLSEADGVHLGQNDLPVWYAREILGQNKIVGISASGVEKVLSAEKLPVDYIGCGAIFPTETKTDVTVRGLEVLKEIKKRNICKPIIAIGGINKYNIADVIKAGADGVAVVSAVCGAKDIKKEAQTIKEIIKNIKG
ncbi:MAG: thiamine phosphate synthase [Elusimicrobia bacterium]|nr:thiamine phosphate synthase [Elusimicrobiota bacterium]